MILLGAGVMGLVMATELTARGHPVRLADPAGGPGPQGCSWWAGGMLAPWCEAESAGEPVLRLGREAIGWWDRHTGLVTRRGTLVLALDRDRGELARFARRSEGHQAVDAAGIAELEPDLAGRFAGGLFFPEEAHLAPRAALEELRRRLPERVTQGLGNPDPNFHIGETTETRALAATERQRAERMEAIAGAPGGLALRIAGEGTTAGPAREDGPRIIDCRGLSARDALPDLRGVRGEMLVLRCPELRLSRPVRLLHPRIPLYIVPRGDGIYMLGATMIESDRRGPPTLRALLELMSAAFALHPAFAEAEVLEIGADARPAFPDNLPRLRRQDARLHANGLYRHGFLLAPALARMAAEHLETGAAPELMDDPA